MLVIRPAEPDDLEGIFAIYDEHVLRGISTFETIPKTTKEREEWYTGHRPDHYPLVVAVDDGGVIGWAGLSGWSARQAYARTAENSVYVRTDRQGRGLGRLLLHDLIERADRDTPVRVIVARIVQPNPASVRLHKAEGFAPIGLMRRCGEKFGTLLDVLLMDRHSDGAGVNARGAVV